ncbi:hypothetical protein ACFSCW_01585 [Sphingomonas tabacisoli]|uniref:DUF4440 domain-containing protein n=1 Tax=Sphingomonas tabacisoli TaxID=2249466 RepID=A0ABW4I068_9SPHN
MRHLLFCALALAVPAAPALARPSPAAAAQSAYLDLIAADRGWSEQARGKDLVSALAAMMDKDAVLVSGGAPDLIRGAEAIRARLAAKPENATSAVEWTPLGGGISADGTHGFTYGAMTVRPKDGAPQPLKYLAYWVKRPEGWRVFGYKRLGMKEGLSLAPGNPILAWGGKRDGDAGATLKASEGAFSAEAQKIGLRAAFQKWGRPDSINLGTGEGITIGARAIGEGVGPAEPVSSVTWAADEVMVAPSGDMGLSYGLLHVNNPKPDGPRTIPFFTIWARPAPGDPWRYVAE